MGLTNVNVHRGLSIFRSIDLDESEEEVCARECVVFSIYASNTNASARWLKLYNATAAATTVGTTTPVATFYLPASGANPMKFDSTVGLRFDTALSAAVVTGVADNDTTGPGANEVVVVIGYA
jgi:hypothetical protein